MKIPAIPTPLTLIPIAIFALLSCAGTASAQILFTTQNDFSTWSSSNTGVWTAATSATDLDGLTVNGLGNTSTPGAPGTAGSLAVTLVNGSGYSDISTGEASNTPFNTTLGQATSITIEYSTPTTPTSGNYFNLPDLVIQGGGSVGYNNIGVASSTTTGGITTATYNISPTLAATFATDSLSGAAGFGYYLQFGILENYNSNYQGSTFNVDAITAQVAAVPEPSSVLLMGFGAFMLLIIGRRLQLQS